MRFVLPPLSASAPTVRTDYVGNLVYRDGLLGRILVDGGAIAAKDSTLAPVNFPNTQCLTYMI